MITVVETPEYIKRISRLVPESYNRDVITYLAANPDSGDLIVGTGGVRKLRWAKPGSGKSGGIRVIYYLYNETMPLFLLTAFGKNEQDNLSEAERNELKKLTLVLRTTYGAKP